VGEIGEGWGVVGAAGDGALNACKATEIWGWAWADGGVGLVEVSVDDGSWQRAQLEPAAERAWQRFTLPWMPIKCGTVTLASRATTASGECQPASGRRNAIYRVSVKVT